MIVSKKLIVSVRDNKSIFNKSKAQKEVDDDFWGINGSKQALIYYLFDDL